MADPLGRAGPVTRISLHPRCQQGYVFPFREDGAIAGFRNVRLH